MFGSQEATGNADDRIRRILDENELKYIIDDDFDFQVGFNLEGRRSQTAIIRSRTYEFLGIEIRDISSAALVSQGPFDARTANILLQQNGQVALGAWSVSLMPDDQHIALFSAKIAADLGPTEFLGVLQSVLTIADEMENRLSGRDEF
jgi:hypothetical protein